MVLQSFYSMTLWPISRPEIASLHDRPIAKKADVFIDIGDKKKLVTNQSMASTPLIRT